MEHLWELILMSTSIFHYTGGNVLLDLALDGDYSIINDVIPTFFINVEPAENNPNLSIDSKKYREF